MLLATESNAPIVVTTFVIIAMLLTGGILLLRVGQARAVPGNTRSGRAQRGWGIGLVIFAVISLLGQIADITGVLDRSNTTGEKGFAGKPAHEIVNAAVDEMEQLTSVRMAGAETTAGVTTEVDVLWARSGPCQITASQADQRITMVLDGEDAYVRYNAAALDEFASAAEARAWRDLVGSRWALLSVDEITQDFPVDQICSLVDRIDELRAHRRITAAAVEVVGGQDAVRVGDATGDDKGTMWVAVREPHWILRFSVYKKGLGSADYSFSEFDEHDDLRVPAKGRWVDLRGEEGV